MPPIDKTASLCSSVRREAMKMKGAQAPEDALRDTLKMCDGLRDDVLPRHGLRLDDPVGDCSRRPPHPCQGDSRKENAGSQGTKDRLTKRLGARERELERATRAAAVEPRDLFRTDEYAEWDGG